MTPLVPLETFRQEMRLNPFHFWGLANATVPLPADCSSLVFEYGWQSGGDSAGRDDIRRSIEQAETMLRDYLTYSIAPRYTTETLRFPQYADKSQFRVGYAGSDGRWLPVQLRQSRVIKVGVEALSFIGTVTTNPGGGMVVTDSDGDGLDDTFTITIATTVTDPDQIAVYAGSPYRLDGEGVGERWRITPVSVQISGGQAVIRGRSWMLVKPVLYQIVGLASIDPGVDSNFMGTLDVYRRYTDPTGSTTDTGQSRLIWETPPWPFWATDCSGGSGVSFGDSAADPAAEAYAIGRVTLRDAWRGTVGVGEAIFNATDAVWEAVNMSFCRPPDRIDVRYQAGEALVNGQVNPRWAQVVCRLAAALLGRRVCQCDTVSRELYSWQIDRAFAGSRDSEQYTLAVEDLSNPFGTRAGAIHAWRAVEVLREVRGVLA